MDITFYIDIYFAVNFSMDFIILCIVSKLKKAERRYLKLLISSATGAFLSTVIILLEGRFQGLTVILGYIVAPVIMCLLAYGLECLEGFISSILYLYAVTIMFGGLLNCIFYNFSFGKYLRQIFGMGGRNSVSLVMLIMTVGVLLICLPYLGRYLNRFRKRTNHIYSVSLCLDGKWVNAKGLFDTGNHLREPISNKPAIITERSLLNQIMEKSLLEYATRVKVIPYRSIGKEHGTMYALVIDELKVTVDDEVHEHKEVIACIYEGTLSSKKDYQLILHEELL